MPPKARNDGEERLCFAHVKEVMPEGSPYDVLVVASDGSLDRQDEIIDPAGWDLANFHRNPVILAAHMHRLSDGRSPVVGHAPLAEVRDGQLLIGIKFADTDLGSEYHSLYRGGHMRAVSVGFMPTAGEWREDGAGGAKGRVWVHTRQELWETSCVAVGANPNALARMRAAAAKLGADPRALDEKTLDALAEKITEHLRRSEAPAAIVLEAEYTNDPRAEKCQRCGRRYATVWAADDALWMKVVGSEAGLYCPMCFDALCRERGIYPTWGAVEESDAPPDVVLNEIYALRNLLIETRNEIIACLPDPIGLDAPTAPGPAAGVADRSAGAGEARADSPGRARAARLLAACRE